MTNSKPRILITGATRGIGRATAFALQDFAHLVLVGRDEKALEALVAELPSAEYVLADLSDSQKIIDGMREARECGALGTGSGGLDGAVLSAGVLAGDTVENTKPGDWEFALHMNVTAQAVLTAQILPELREARGTIVFVNSGSGFTSKPGNAVYSATKFALRALSDALREEERERGVRVVSLHPGRVATDMQRELRAYEGGEYVESDYMKPETIGEAVRYALTAPPEANIDVLSIRPR